MFINIIYIIIILILVFVIYLAFKTVKKNISSDNKENIKTEFENKENDPKNKLNYNEKLNLVEEIKKIEELHSNGILSDEEFDLAKKKLLE